MESRGDQQLLREFVENRSQQAFETLVHNYIDLVYSAALRMVRNSHLAEDVSQNVFQALAEKAHTLVNRTSLAGWLHCTTHNIACNLVRSEVRRRFRENEAAVMNQILSQTEQQSWDEISPELDSALTQLPESDRELLLLRYFQKNSTAEISSTTGLSAEAVQKRVSRALEKLRKIFSRRGITIGPVCLAGLLTNVSVQAAPTSLPAVIFASSTITGAAATSAYIKSASSIAMTTLQKSIIGTSFVAAICTMLYQQESNRSLREQNEQLVQAQTEMRRQVQSARDQLTERGPKDDASGRSVSATANEPAVSSELLRLRGEVARLRSLAAAGSDPKVRQMLQLQDRAMDINRFFDEMPEKRIPELAFLQEEDWLAAVKTAKLDSEENVRRTLSDLRSKAKNRIPMASALNAYINENKGEIPHDLSLLKPYIKTALQRSAEEVSASGFQTPPTPDDTILDAILSRYKLLQTGSVSQLKPDSWIIAETAPVDKDFDSRAKFGNGTSIIIGTGRNSAGDPDDKHY